MICKFKDNFDIIIANIRLLNDILSKGTLFRLCEKLYIKIPPILTFYRKGDGKIKEKLEKEYTQYKLIEYDKENTSFPERYILAVQALYSEVSVDIKKANEVWLRSDEPEVSFNPRQWLVQEGFMNAIESSKFGKIAEDMKEMIALIKKKLAAESEKEIKINERKQREDYKNMYFDIKKI